MQLRVNPAKLFVFHVYVQDEGGSVVDISVNNLNRSVKVAPSHRGWVLIACSSSALP